MYIMFYCDEMFSNIMQWCHKTEITGHKFLFWSLGKRYRKLSNPYHVWGQRTAAGEDHYSLEIQGVLFLHEASKQADWASTYFILLSEMEINLIPQLLLHLLNSMIQKSAGIKALLSAFSFFFLPFFSFLPSPPPKWAGFTPLVKFTLTLSLFVHVVS